VEWYYGDGSYVSVGFFDKTVKNAFGFRGQSSVVWTVENRRGALRELVGRARQSSVKPGTDESPTCSRWLRGGHSRRSRLCQANLVATWAQMGGPQHAAASYMT
jgi:hypothetical protein